MPPVETEPVIVDGSAGGGTSPHVDGSAGGGTPADLFAPALLVVRLRGYDREAELHYFDREAASVLAALRGTLPTDGDFPAALHFLPGLDHVEGRHGSGLGSPLHLPQPFLCHAKSSALYVHKLGGRHPIPELAGSGQKEILSCL